MNDKKLRLAWELSSLEQALRGIAVLGECLRMGQLGNHDQEQHAVAAIPAVIAMVCVRLVALRYACAGETDPRELMNERNSDPAHGPDDAGLVLTSWTLSEQLQHCTAELYRLQRQIERESDDDSHDGGH